MQWSVTPRFEDANHPPFVLLNHDEDLTVDAGGQVTLDASPTWDPDGDELEFNWWVYQEAGSYDKPIRIDNAGNATVKINIPDDAAGKTIHVICEVKDKADYPMTRYRRIVLTVAQTPVETHGRLRVEGNRIVGEHGQPVQLMGMSLYWSVWGPQKYYNRETVDWLVADWKVDLVRASMAVEINQQEENKGWLYNRESQERMVETVIEAAIENGIYVLVDWHTHHLHTEPAREFFEYLAKKYGHHPNLIWETFNEPVKQSWPEIAEFTKEVTAVIRPYSDNLIIAGTRNWSQFVDEAADDPLPDANTAYSLHFYAGTHGKDLRDKGDYALSKGIALFITEWGTSRADGGRDGTIFPDETREWINWALERDISMANWSLADLRESSAALAAGLPSREAGIRRMTSPLPADWCGSSSLRLTVKSLMIKIEKTSTIK